ncbi:hypothetical protein [Fusobacterium sp. MFO224]|uniref:hypothetical protein n=1 Tax=Fusobacterium sp. MFO224 TaxID=3378070 RepID=UPI003853273A
MKKNKILFSTDPIMKDYIYLFEKNLKKYFRDAIYITGSEPSKYEMNFLQKKTKVLSRHKGKIFNLFRKRYNIYLENHYENLIEKYKDIDYILAIGGVYYSGDFLRRLKKINPSIRTIAFLWDDFSEEIIEIYKEDYDVVYTFEKSSALKYGLKFRPSFYLERVIEKKKIDCYYLGTLRESERYNKINEIFNYCKKNKLKNDLKLYIEKKNMIKDYKNSSILIHEKIGYKENLEKCKSSKVVIELNYKNQKGLTLRSLECIGFRSKLITENEDIKNYDFYNPENIYVIKNKDDIKNIPLSFFEENYKTLDKKIENKYSLEGFLKEIFAEGEKL